MTCLNEAEIQAVADGEAAGARAAHAETCGRCAPRVDEQRRRVSTLTAVLGPPADVPEAMRRRLEGALAHAASSSAGLEKGATRLRPGEAAPVRWRRPSVFIGLAAAAVIVLMVVLPTLNGPGTVSASEVLAQSLQQLGQEITSGVELREYELVLDGVPREVMPDQQSGTYRIEQVIDHDVPGRYRMSTFAPSGTLLSAVSEDIAAHRRTSVFRLDPHVYRFELDVPNAPRISMPDIERLHNEATVAVMQASAEKHLKVVEGAGGRAYLIEIPRVAAPGEAPLWDLQEARILIDATDYRIRELAVRGTFMRKPYALSYKLIRRQVRPSAEVPREEFDVPETPGAVVLSGPGTENPMRDALVLSLRELAEARASR
jgi:hypothetical protein